MGGQPPVNVRRVGGKHNTVKQADSGLGGWMLRKFQGEPLKPDHIFVFCQASFRMTLSRVGFPMMAPGSLILYSLGLKKKKKSCRGNVWCLYQTFVWFVVTENKFWIILETDSLSRF